MDRLEKTEMPLLVEEQHTRQSWLWLILAALVGVIWYGFWRQIIQGEPFGNHPAPDWVWWILLPLIGLGVPWLLYTVALRVEVHQEEIVVRFTTPLFPLFRKTIRLAKLQSAEAVAYRPFWDYGSWGIRMGAKGWACSVSGNHSVRLKMTHDRGILLGSQRPERLAIAIEQALAERNRSVRP